MKDFSLPLIEDQLDKLFETEVFCTLDLKNGFFHVLIEEKSIKYTSYVVLDGQFKCLVVPFGLSNFSVILSAVHQNSILRADNKRCSDDLFR